ncbi:zinc-binding alcohol dehydrogenase family protein, partial [Pseudomonas aeruginosa]
LEPAVPAQAAFRRLAIIAPPADGHVRLPAMKLYRRGGSVVGINSLLYGVDSSPRINPPIRTLLAQGRPAVPDRVAALPAD